MTPRSDGSRHLAGGVGVGLLAVLPLLASDYLLGILTLAFVYGVFALSVDLVWGYAGVLTFGHAAFFGTGSYVLAFLRPASVLLGIGTAIVVAGLLGVAIAYPLFRRRIGAEYFAIITLAIAVIANQVAVSWADVTGGSNGILVPQASLPFPTGSLPLSGIPFYVIALVVLCVVYFAARRFVGSPLGHAVVGIASNGTKARSLGYDVARYRTVTFGVSAGIAGLAGALYALQSGFVSPPLLGFELSTAVLIWVLVGGRGTLTGAVVGALVITVFEKLVSGVFVFYWTFLLGVVLVLVVVAAPGGLVGAVDRLSDRLYQAAEPGGE